MEKTLKKIQVLAKVGRILSMIVFIASIVGAVGSALGMFSLAIIGEKAFVVGGVTVHGMIESGSGANVATVYASLIVAIICCLGEIYVAKLAQKYFEYEIEVKTPFTLDGAKKLKKLGIVVIIVSIVCIVLSAIAVAIVEIVCEMSVVDASVNANLADGSQVALGIMFIVMSLMLRYVAEKYGDDVPAGVAGEGAVLEAEDKSEE